MPLLSHCIFSHSKLFSFERVKTRSVLICRIPALRTQRDST